MIEGNNGKISKELFDITKQTLDCYTSDIRWDILVQTWINKDNRGRGLKTEAIFFDECNWDDTYLGEFNIEFKYNKDVQRVIM